MRPLIALLVFFALTVCNTTGVAAAICQHEDGRAHEAAMSSSDLDTAAQAAHEESAQASTEKQAKFADWATGSLSIFILPSTVTAFPMPSSAATVIPGVDSSTLAGRSISPLLEPPSA